MPSLRVACASTAHEVVDKIDLLADGGDEYSLAGGNGGNDMLSTTLTRRFGIDHPIVQAGMGMNAGHGLAAAVSNAGGLGTVGTIGRSPKRAVVEIEATRTATGRPYAVNVLTFDFGNSARPIIDAVIDAAPPVVTLSFGEPTRYVERCRSAGCLTLVQVQDVAGLRAALDAGADAVIVQGNEAGGHTGRRGTLSFLAQALDLAGEVPILAAGGIATGRGLAGALAMGAAGCVMGTRFKATIEFETLVASEKERIVASDGDDSVYDEISDVAFGVEFPAGIAPRVLRSEFTETWHGRDDELRKEVNAMAPLAFVMDLASHGNVINFAGESAGLIDEILPAAEVIRRTVAEAERHLGNVPAIVSSAPLCE